MALFTDKRHKMLYNRKYKKCFSDPHRTDTHNDTVHTDTIMCKTGIGKAETIMTKVKGSPNKILEHKAEV